MMQWDESSQTLRFIVFDRVYSIDVFQEHLLTVCGGDYNSAYFTLMAKPLPYAIGAIERWVKVQSQKSKVENG
jgi:hypothetical protein